MQNYLKSLVKEKVEEVVRQEEASPKGVKDEKDENVEEPKKEGEIYVTPRKKFDVDVVLDVSGEATEIVLKEVPLFYISFLFLSETN